MALDTNIALQARPVQLEGPLDMAGKAMTLRHLASQGQLQDMQIQQAQREQEQAQTLASLYRNSTGADGNLDTQGLLRGMAQSGLGAKIPGFQKQLLEAEEARGKVAETTTRTAGLNQDQAIKAHNFAMQRLGAVQSPEEFEAWAAESVRAKAVDPEKAAGIVAQVRANPAAFGQVKQQLMLSGADVIKQLETTAPKVETTDLGNRSRRTLANPLTGEVISQAESIKAPEGFVVGPDGRLSADPGFVAAKSQIARAGATSLNVNTTKPLLNTMAEELGKQLGESLSGAQTAQQTIGVTQKLQTLLNSGNLITGPGADARVIVNQLANGLGVGGNTDAEKLSNTRQVMQGLAQLELQAGAAMKGQGAITDSERMILKAAAAGQINMSLPELKALAQTLEDRAYKRIETHQAGVKRLESIPEAKQLVPFYKVDAPPRAAVVAPAQDWKGAGYASKAQAVQDALGAIQRGADKATVVQRLEAAGITNHGIK